MIKKTKKWYLTLSIIGIFVICIIILYLFLSRTQKTTIKIGILHSLTGDLAISERPVADATLLAIKEINTNGGVLGRQIEALLIDGKSDENVFAEQAQRLITEEKVAAIFGCWTSPSRIRVKEIVEQYNSILFYPVQFEGLENSDHIVYTGTTPNQQIIPGVTWCLHNLGKKFFLVGSDHIVHEIIKDVVYAHNGTIVGDEYLALNSINVESIIQKIIDTQPDVIFNDIEGEQNIAFFAALRTKGITPEKIPTMSFSVSEPELVQFDNDEMTGDYAAWSYFESVDTPENRLFVKKIKAAYGTKNTIGDAMESAYYGVYLWKQAIEKTDSTESNLVRSALHNQAFNAPQGLIHIADKSLQMWQFARIGKIRSDKKFTILWSSAKAVQPVPYPPTRTVDEWKMLYMQLRQKENKK